MSGDSKETANDWRSFLDSSIEATRSYHDHKEDMAWVATAFYIPSILGIAHFGAPELGTVAWFLFMPILAFAAITSAFVAIQFYLRWLANLELGVLRRHRLEHTPGHPELDVTYDEGAGWPAFIASDLPKVDSRSGGRAERHSGWAVAII